MVAAFTTTPFAYCTTHASLSRADLSADNVPPEAGLPRTAMMSVSGECGRKTGVPSLRAYTSEAIESVKEMTAAAYMHTLSAMFDRTRRRITM